MFNSKCQWRFDASRLNRAIARAEKKVLRRQGAYLRGIAKRKIRRRRNFNLSSAPGKPPFTHTGVLKKSIWFVVLDESVIIGPAANWIGDIGELHEFGGRRRVLVPAGIKDKYKVGEVGPVSTRKYKRAKASRYRKPYYDMDGSPVAWVRIKSPTQAAHSSRVARRLRRKYTTVKTVTYPARPYMGPTLDESKDKLADFWKDTIKA